MLMMILDIITMVKSSLNLPNILNVIGYAFADINGFNDMIVISFFSILHLKIFNICQLDIIEIKKLNFRRYEDF